MMTMFALMLCALGQPEAHPRVQAIAPFVDSDVLAVIQLDLARGDIRGLAERLAGERSSGPVADAVKALMGWSESLRGAGAKELDVVVSLGDLPGIPSVVVPLGDGVNEAEVRRLLCGQGQQRPPITFPACSTIHNAVMAGTAASLERARQSPAALTQDLAAAWAAVGEEKFGLRLFLLPSPDTRRVVEELVPKLPRDLGGGPITDLTHGLLWAAAGVEIGPNPSFKLVVASPSPDAARSIQRLGQDLLTLVKNSPELRNRMPELPKLASQIKTEIAGDRVTVTADARDAAQIFNSALRPAREAALRSQCVNNEKQIALAMHNYAHRHKSAFPPAFSTDNASKPLLSWRVLILPYLDQGEVLYKEFHLDETWDSPHNKALIARMPAVYRCPNQSDESARLGKTCYLAPRGPETIFNGAAPVKLTDIADGTSNTILFFDAGDERSVTWTKPADWDLPADPTAALPGMLSAHQGRGNRGTDVAFADGSVRFIREALKPATLRALFSYAGGEAISNDEF
jgi:hypothetical protein